MKRKKLYYAVVPIALLLVLVVVILGVWQMSRPTTLHVAQFASGSSGEFWTYELSTDKVIKEIEYKENILGSEQEWSFEQIGVGEVTIRWNAHEGLRYNESGSYSITYYFDEDGNYTVLEDMRESQK